METKHVAGPSLQDVHTAGWIRLHDFASDFVARVLMGDEEVEDASMQAL